MVLVIKEYGSGGFSQEQMVATVELVEVYLPRLRDLFPKLLRNLNRPSHRGTLYLLMEIFDSIVQEGITLFQEDPRHWPPHPQIGRNTFFGISGEFIGLFRGTVSSYSSFFSETLRLFKVFPPFDIFSIRKDKSTLRTTPEQEQ